MKEEIKRTDSEAMLTVPRQQYATVTANSGITNTRRFSQAGRSMVMDQVRKTPVRSETPKRGRSEDASEQEPNQSQKEEEFQKPKGRKNKSRKVVYGKSKVIIGGEMAEAAEAAPYEVYIGNTHPKCDEESVKTILKECSKDMLEEELDILHVKCLTRPRTDGVPPHSKQFMVRVSSRFRDHMMKSDAYPAGWSTRRFYPARSQSNKDVEQNPRKKPHLAAPQLVGVTGLTNSH